MRCDPDEALAAFDFNVRLERRIACLHWCRLRTFRHARGRACLKDCGSGAECEDRVVLGNAHERFGTASPAAGGGAGSSPAPICARPASAQHAPLLCTPAPQVSACAALLFRHHGVSTPVLRQNHVAKWSFQRRFGPKSDATMRHMSHSPTAEHCVPGTRFNAAVTHRATTPYPIKEIHSPNARYSRSRPSEAPWSVEPVGVPRPLPKPVLSVQLA